MEKKRKYRRSSYKGEIRGGYYHVDARRFKNAEQRARVERNLETKEGRLRLLKNSNPTCWMLVIGQVESVNADDRWCGCNWRLRDEPALKRPLQHRIAHLLRLDDKKYYRDKLFAMRVLSEDLYHHKFLQDYINFYESIESHMKEFDPLNHESPPQLHHVTYSELEKSSALQLDVIIRILKSWDRQYAYPKYLYDFIDRVKEKITPVQTLLESRSYWNSLFYREHTLRWVLFLDPRKDRVAEGFPQFEKDIASIDLESLSEDVHYFTAIAGGPRKRAKKRSLSAEDFALLKESLFHRFFRLYRVYSYSLLSYDLNHELHKDLFKRYRERLRAIKDLLIPIKMEALKKNSFSLWNIKGSHKDNLLYKVVDVLKYLTIFLPLEELEREDAQERNVEQIESLIEGYRQHGPFPGNSEELNDIEEEGKIYEAEGLSTIDSYLLAKYNDFVEDCHKNREIVDSQFWLKTPNPAEMSRKLLEGFHEMDEEEQTFRLELLYLSEGTVPDDTCYTTSYQFYLMLLTISLHWEEERYLPFFKRELYSGDERKVVPLLNLLRYSSMDGSRKLLQLLYDFWSMERSPKVRLALVKAFIECDEFSWWTEERKKLLRSWIRVEEDEEVLKEVRRFWRYLK